jgi:hypothetical protein
MNNPEFKIGDYVTYCWGTFIMRGVVINVYYEADQPRYVLHEEPEGKPLAKHNQVDTHPAYIAQSQYFKGWAPASVYNYDKETRVLSEQSTN